MSQSSVVLHAPYSRRLPAPSDAPSHLSSIETHVFRVPASEVPAGIPDDANPREPNLNRQVYRRVRQSLLGAEGTGTFHLKHGGIVLLADRVEALEEGMFRLTFDDEAKQGIANGGHSYNLILQAQEEDEIPSDQYVEIKVHVGVPSEVGPDLADGLNTSMQVREESLADLKGKFDWLKDALAGHSAGPEPISWHEGNPGEYDVREVIALLMALDPTRYGLENPVGIENTYARLSTVFRSYLGDSDRVERFAPIAAQALVLYEFIRVTAPDLWDTARFSTTKLADIKRNSVYKFHYLLDENGQPTTTPIRLTKAAAIPCFAAFRALVDAPDDGEAIWKYDFSEVKGMWTEHGGDLLREVHEAVMRQHGGNTHYAGRSPMLYRATTKTLELADLRRQIAG